MDLNTYMQNPEQYKENDVIITADLKNFVENLKLYENMQVELTAPVTYYGSRGFWTWQLFLERDDHRLRCYETNYRISPGWDAKYLLTLATSEGGEVTVRGRATPQGIELRRLFYKGITVDTDYKPYRLHQYSYNGGYYFRSYY